MSKPLISQCCLERELATRLQRARALTLSRALEQIGRVKSLEKAQEIARDALRAEWIVIDAMDGVEMPSMEPSRLRSDA